MPASALLLRLCCIGAAADDDDDGDDDDDDDDNDDDDDDDDPVIDGGSTIASPCPTRWWRRGSAPSVAMVMVILEGSQPSAISYLMRKAIRCHQRCHPRCHPRCDEDLLEGPQPSAVSYLMREAIKGYLGGTTALGGLVPGDVYLALRGRDRDLVRERLGAQGN